MRVVVTGAAGFIGSNLVDYLLAETTDEIVGIDAFTDYYDPAVKRTNLSAASSPRFTLIEGDLNSLDLASVLHDVEVVYHQAGQPGVRKSWGSDFLYYSDQNINATQRLLEAAISAPRLRRFVLASSSSVYGNAERYPTLETDRPAPLSPYGVTKLAAEHLGLLYATNFNVPVVVLRYFTVYGPRQRPDMAFHAFVSALLRSEAIKVFGNGNQIREYTHVSDIVRANLLAATRNVPAGSVINLSGGASVSVNDVLASLTTIHGKRPEIDFRPAVAGDVKRTGGSTERARDLLDWAPMIGLHEGLQTEYAWLASMLAASTA